jgi:hypothetical protein
MYNRDFYFVTYVQAARIIFKNIFLEMSKTFWVTQNFFGQQTNEFFLDAVQETTRWHKLFVSLYPNCSQKY